MNSRRERRGMKYGLKMAGLLGGILATVMMAQDARVPIESKSFEID